MMKEKRERLLAFFLALVLLGALDLLVLLLWPARVPDGARPPVVGACLVAGALALVAFPFVLKALDRQTGQIERQQKVIDTSHALDTAIVRELDMPRLLDTAVRRLMRVLDVEAAGIVLTPPDGPEEYAFLIPDRADREKKEFEHVVRQGGISSATVETLVLPLQDSEGVPGFVGVGRFRNVNAGTTARPFAPFEHGLLASLMDTLVVALTNARAFAAQREAFQVQEDLERERRVARAMTESLLSPVPALPNCWQISTCYEAKSPDAPVGGDLYDLFLIDKTRLGVVLADVSGKGLAAAQKLALIKYSLRAYAREHPSPADVVRRLNDTLFDEPDMTGFVTLFYGVLEVDTRRFTFTSAGHEPTLLRHADGTIAFLEPDGLVLGVERTQEYEDCTTDLQPGDALLLYTDGLSESRPSKSDPFLGLSGIAAIVTNLLATPERPAPAEMTTAILHDARRRAQDHLNDDVALLWLECAVSPA